MPSVFYREPSGKTVKQMYSSNGGDAHRSTSSSSSFSSSSASSAAWSKHVSANSSWENNRQSGGYGSREKFDRSDDRERFFLKKDWNFSVDNRSSTNSSSATSSSSSSSSSSSAPSISASGSYRSSNGLPGPATKRRAIGRHGPIVENGRYVTTAACRSTLDSSFSALRTPLESKVERDGYGSPVTERPNNKDIVLDGQHHHFLSPSDMRPPPPPYNNTQRFDPNSRYDSSHSSHRLNYVNNNSTNDSYHRGSYVNNSNGIDGRERSKINGFPYAWDPPHRDRDRDNRAWNRPDYYHRRTCSLPKLDSPLREWGVLDRELGESRMDRYGREPTFLDDRDHSYGDWEVRERSHQPKSFPSFADSLPINNTSHLRDDVAAINTTSHPRDQVVATFNNISVPREEGVATMNKASYRREELATINNTSHLREEVAAISNSPYLREEVAKTIPSDPKAVNTSMASPLRLPLSPLKSPFMHDSSNKRGNNSEIDSPKKRPRLTWGQGLAKYEKEKTEEEPLVSRKQQEGIQQGCSIDDIEVLPVDASDCLPMSKDLTCEGECQTQKKNIDHNCHTIQEEQINAGLSQRDSKNNLLDDVIIPSIKRESTERNLTDQIESSTTSGPFGCEISVASTNVHPSVLHDVKVFLENYQRERPNVSKEFLTQHVEIVEYEIDLIEKEISKLDCEEAAQLSRIINTDQGVSSSPLVEADRYVSVNQTEGMKQKYDEDSEKNFGESNPICERELPIKAVDLVMDEIIDQVVSLSHMQIVEHGTPISMDGHGDLIYSLLSSNQEIAKGSWSALTHLNSPLMEVILQDGRLYDCPQEANMWRLNAESHEKKKLFLQSKICNEKRSTRFMEKVLAIKYRTWREAWKQEQVSKSLRKDGGDKTTHSSILSVLNQQSVARPYGATVSSLPNLWIESEREFLRMPSMLLGKKVRSLHSFETKNALVEDPITAENERKVMNPWSAEERKTFLEKYALLGKDFRKIASFLKHKAVADCIEFYYRNQKVEEFQKIHRRHQLKKRRDSRASGLYLATTTSASTRHREVNRACMEGLTLVAAAAAAISAPKSTAMNSSTISTKGCRDRYSGRPRNSTTMPLVKVSNKEQGVKGSLLYGRQQQLRLSQEESDSHWTDGERLLFMEALAMFGKDFNSICLHVGTKNTRQCKSFFSKARSRLGLDQVVERHKTVTESARGNCEASTHITVDMKSQIFEDMKPQHPGLDQAVESHKMVIQNMRENCKASMNIAVDVKPQVFEDIKIKTFKNIKPHNSEDVKCQVMENVKLQMIEDIKVESEDIKVESTVDSRKYEFLKQNMINTTVVDASSSGFITEVQSKISDEGHSDPQAAGIVNALNFPEDVGDANGVHMASNPVFGAMSENLNEGACSDGGGGEDNLITGSLHQGEVIEKLVGDRVEDNLMATGLTGGKTQQLVHENVEDISMLNVDNEGFHSTPFGCNLKAMRLLKETVPVSKNLNPKEVKTRREPTSWTQEEKAKFNDVLKVHGRNWDRLHESLPSKSLTQIKTYFQNSKAKLGLGPGAEGSLSGSGKVAMPRKRKIDDSDSSNNQGSGGQSPLSRASGQSDGSSLIATPNILPASGGLTVSNMLNTESRSFIARSAQKEDSPNNQDMAFNPVAALNSLFNPGIFASPNTQQSQPTDLLPPPQVTIAPAAIQQEQGIVGRMTQDVSLPMVQLLHTPTIVHTTKQKQILQPQVAEPKKMQPQLVQRPQQLRLQQPFRNHQQASNPVLANSSIHQVIGSSQHADLPLGKPQVNPNLQQSAQIQQLQHRQCHQQRQQQQQQPQPQPQIYEVQNLTQHGNVPLANEQQQHIVTGLSQLSSSNSNRVETPPIKQCDAGGFHAIARIQKAEPVEDLRNELNVHSTRKSLANGDVKLFGQSLLSQPAINNQQSSQQLNSKICSVPYAEGAVSTCPISFITANGVMDNNVASHLSASGDGCKQGLLPLKQQIVCPKVSSVKHSNAVLQRPNLCNEADCCAFQAVAQINDNLIGAIQINDSSQPTESVSVSQFMVSAISHQNSSANILPKLSAQPSDPKAFSCDLGIPEHGSKRCDQILGCERQGIEMKNTRAQDLCLTDGIEAVPSHGLPRVLSALVALAEWRLQNANGGNSERLTDEFLNQSWEALQRDPGALVEAGKARGVFSHLNSVKLDESGMADALRNVDGNMGGGAGE